MGLFSFFKKDAGKKVESDDKAGGGIIKSAEASEMTPEAEAEVEAAKAAAPGIDATAVASDAIKKEIEKLNLDVKDLDVEVDGETVKVKGKALDQATREKVVLAAGNVEGISAVDEAIETEQTGPESQFHEVAKGDTLWAISEKYYGNGAKYEAIVEANQPMITNPDMIYPGQVLRIPPQD